MSHNISLLLKQNNLEITQQPYDLQMAEVDSKLILSMSLNVQTPWTFYIDTFVSNKYIVFIHLISFADFEIRRTWAYFGRRWRRPRY